MKGIGHCAALAVLVALAGCASQAMRPQDCEVARRYIEAGNTGKAELVAPLLADDVTAVFLAADGEAHTLHGKAAVVEAVENYTAQCSSCRSDLRCLHTTSDAVYVIEDVVFMDQDGVQRQQSAPLVIEMRDERVETIIYYPSPAETD